MYKELTISIIIVALIFGLNYVTQKNTDMTVQTVTEKLTVVRNSALEEEPNKDRVTSDINMAYDKWEELDDILSYYIEHDELEKVKSALTSAKSYIEVEEYKESIEAIDNCIYILDHIHEKEMFSLDNIL